jgi:hypothetical protein
MPKTLAVGIAFWVPKTAIVKIFPLPKGANEVMLLELTSLPLLVLSLHKQQLPQLLTKKWWLEVSLSSHGIFAFVSTTGNSIAGWTEALLNPHLLHVCFIWSFPLGFCQFFFCLFSFQQIYHSVILSAKDLFPFLSSSFHYWYLRTSKFEGAVLVVRTEKEF